MKRRELAEKYSRELGFRPRDCTRWLSPGELVRTGVKVGLAGAFAAYADKREVQESFESAALDLSGRDELWMDFVADLGDGFDPTYTVASAVAQPSVQVTEPGSGRPLDLPAGELLVFGGDEVYPASSVQGYEDRTTGPYRAALPAGRHTPERTLLALPGNHDWYDGLTSFLRTFTQGRSYGAWRTKQTRSYFVAQLPHRWWLVGLDTQLAANVDEPQLRYLVRHISTQLEDGDGIIVATAAPYWVHTVTKHNADAFNTLHFVERNYLRRRPGRKRGSLEPTGARVRLWLTGDAHHYARFTEVMPEELRDAETPGRAERQGSTGQGSTGQDSTDPRATQLITCGLGGAYLGITHDVPTQLTLPPEGSRMRDRDEVPRKFRLAAEPYPNRKDSRRQAWFLALPGRRNLLLRNPGFGVFMAGLHVVLFTLISQLYGLYRAAPAVTARRSGDVPGALSFALVVVGVSVAAAVAIATWLAWRRMLTWPQDPSGRSRRVRLLREAWSTAVLWGTQLSIAAAVFVTAVRHPGPASAPWVGLVLAVLLASVAGGVLGSEAFALFVRSADGGQVADWQMSGQAIEDHKGFLRIKVSESGLEVYPLVIDTICRDWNVEATGDGAVRPVPAGDPPRIRLLEPPIRLSRESFPT